MKMGSGMNVHSLKKSMVFVKHVLSGTSSPQDLPQTCPIPLWTNQRILFSGDLHRAPLAHPIRAPGNHDF